jgi:hypothetical protein
VIIATIKKCVKVNTGGAAGYWLARSMHLDHRFGELY